MSSHFGWGENHSPPVITINEPQEYVTSEEMTKRRDGAIKRGGMSWYVGADNGMFWVGVDSEGVTVARGMDKHVYDQFLTAVRDAGNVAFKSTGSCMPPPPVQWFENKDMDLSPAGINVIAEKVRDLVPNHHKHSCILRCDNEGCDVELPYEFEAETHKECSKGLQTKVLKDGWFFTSQFNFELPLKGITYCPECGKNYRAIGKEIQRIPDIDTACHQRIYDGWCAYSALRLEIALANVSLPYDCKIPLYVPPGATADAPYGIAGTDCPYPVIGRGTGLSPVMGFDSTVKPLEAITEILKRIPLIRPYDTHDR